MNLSSLNERLQAALGVSLKRDIEPVARILPHAPHAAWLARDGGPGPRVQNGDDAAAIPDGDGYTLIAAEGMRPTFVDADPWFAGFCSVMVNVSDILAMGGRPYAVVDVLFTGEDARSEQVLAGMQDAATRFGVPVVGGHTSRVGQAGCTLAVAIVGRAHRLLASHAARPGDALVVAVDLRGRYRGEAPFFDAATARSGAALRAAARILPALAEDELAHACKDVSMAGFVGTLAMLCEASGTGATLDLASLPAPAGVDFLRWLISFPSFGYMLAVRPENVAAVLARFSEQGIASGQCGVFDDTRCVELVHAGARARFWDLAATPFTGFGPIAAEG